MISKPTCPESAARRPGISRRTVLKSGCLLLAGGALSCVAGGVYATRVEPEWVQIYRPQVSLPGWPAGLCGLRVAQLSDLHLGNVDAEHIRRGVQIVNSLQPDLILLTGDFVSHSRRYAAACARELAALRSRYGSYAVLGNHDVWTDADTVAGHLQSQGITVLRNASLPLELEGGRLWLLGVEDVGYSGFAGHLPDSFQIFRRRWQPVSERLAGVLDSIPADDPSPRFLLAHNPDFTEMLPAGRIDLAWCGHTHGGQVRLPFGDALVVPSCFGKKYAGGLVQGNGLPVYVNRGLGLARLPVRFNCRPEITLMQFEACMT